MVRNNHTLFRLNIDKSTVVDDNGGFCRDRVQNFLPPEFPFCFLLQFHALHQSIQVTENFTALFSGRSGIVNLVVVSFWFLRCHFGFTGSVFVGHELKTVRRVKNLIWWCQITCQLGQRKLIKELEEKGYEWKMIKTDKKKRKSEE